jgi:uncharacterized HhH-GPD family protein
VNVSIESLTETGPFEFRWPDSVERFDRGWEGRAIADGGRFTIRHGIGARHVYGRERPHSVTWVDGNPVVEGVGADDFDESGCLVSAIKGPDRRVIRTPDRLPASYERFRIVAHDEEVRAPYSRRALAVKIRADDVKGWTLYALLRQRDRGLGVQARRETPTKSEPSLAPLESVTSTVDKRAIADALLAYAASYAHEPGDPLPPLSPDAEADALVREDPFAFLLAVIFDQGIPYERAWRAPLDLRRRLGSLEPASLVADPERVRAAVAQPPALHRYVQNMPKWLVAAARRLLEQYGGDAGAIWAGSPTAKELQGRFQAFDGIGQKKAAMAVELLERHLGVPVAMMEGSDIAYDIHVRRVFLRSGLVDRDDPLAMIEVARLLHPERPGALDDPAWRIGEQWCHRTAPECPACALRSACMKLIERGTVITGA